jgi:hypothetical protein
MWVDAAPLSVRLVDLDKRRSGAMKRFPGWRVQA